MAASGVYDVHEHLKLTMLERQLKSSQVSSFFKPKSAEPADTTTKADGIVCVLRRRAQLARILWATSSPTWSAKCIRTARLPSASDASARRLLRSWNDVCRRPPQRQSWSDVMMMVQHATVRPRRRPSWSDVETVLFNHDRRVDRQENWQATSVLVRYFEQKAACTQLLDMSVCNYGTSEHVFQRHGRCLEVICVSYSVCVILKTVSLVH